MKPCQLETKSTVNFDVVPAIEAAQPVIARVYANAGAKAVCTSARDGKHSRQTAHNDGRAIDLRITNLFPSLQANRREWYAKVLSFAHGLAVALEALPSPGRFDVVLEGSHIHLEYSMQHTPNIKGWTPSVFVYCSAEVRGYLRPQVVA